MGLAGPRPGWEQSRPAPPTWNWGVAQARGAGIRAAPLRDNGSLPRRRARGTKARREAGRPSAKSVGGGRGDGGGPSKGAQAAAPTPPRSRAGSRGTKRRESPRQARGSRRRRREPLCPPHSPTARCPSSWRNLRRLAPAGCSRGPLAPTFPPQDRPGKCLPRKLPPPPGPPVSERDTTEASRRRVPASRQRGGRGPGPRGGGPAGRGRAAVHPGIGAGPHSRARGLAGSPRRCSPSSAALGPSAASAPAAGLRESRTQTPAPRWRAKEDAHSPRLALRPPQRRRPHTSAFPADR